MLSKLDGSLFATGRAQYLDRDPARSLPSAKIHVGIKLDDSVVTLAVLDTGADWSVIQTEVARALGLLDLDGEPKSISTRLGTLHGKLVRVDAELVAEEGESVQLSSTVFVSEDWPDGTFIGYHGFLERVRFAVDPEKNALFFGVPDGYSPT